jgi:hypothetical protein
MERCEHVCSHFTLTYTGGRAAGETDVLAGDHVAGGSFLLMEVSID